MSSQRSSFDGPSSLGGSYDKQSVIFLMVDYIESMYQVVKKNICPQVTYAQIEMSVFFFIQNLMHKCESILLDQLEFYLIEHSLSLQPDSMDEMQYDDNLLNRLKRIYGSTSEQVKTLEEFRKGPSSANRLKE